MASLTRNHQCEQQAVSSSSLRRSRPRSEWVGLRTRIPPIFPTTRASNWDSGDWIKPSVAEVLDQGGSAVERGRACPVPSPRGTLPTWIPSGDNLNLVHNRQTIQPGAGEHLLGFFSGALSCLSVPRLLHLPCRFCPSLPWPGWFPSSPSDLSQITRVYKTSAHQSLVPRHGPIQGSPVADCVCPTTRLQSCPHPWQISSCEIRSSLV